MRPPIECWNIEAEIQPLRGGHRNLAFRTIGLGVGRDLVFKSTRRTEASIRWLLQVHAIARRSGIEIPELRRSLGGNLVENGWTCEGFVHGSLAPKADLKALLPLVKQFHRNTDGVSQRPGFESSNALMTLEKGGDVDLSKMPSKIASKCQHACRGIEKQQMSIIHGDLSYGNLMRTPNGCVALIDWDECRRDHVSFDIHAIAPQGEEMERARIAWEVACSWQIDPDYAVELATKL